MKAETQSRIREEWAKKRGEVSNFRMRPPMDEGDMSNFHLVEDVNYELLNLCNKNLKDVELALQRLDTGTYGICEECGKEISEKRLRALPFALNCLDCQQEKENLGSLKIGLTKRKNIGVRRGNFLMGT
jgi:DnaK suppressor protein